MAGLALLTSARTLWGKRYIGTKRVARKTLEAKSSGQRISDRVPAVITARMNDAKPQGLLPSSKQLLRSPHASVPFYSYTTRMYILYSTSRPLSAVARTRVPSFVPRSTLDMRACMHKIVDNSRVVELSPQIKMGNYLIDYFTELVPIPGDALGLPQWLCKNLMPRRT